MVVTGYMSDVNSLALLTLDEAVNYAQQHIHPGVDAKLISSFEQEGLLPAYGKAEKCYLRGDLEALGPLFSALGSGDSTRYAQRSLFADDLPSSIRFGQDTWLPVGEALAIRDEPAVRPAVRHLAQVAASQADAQEELRQARTLPWLGGTCVRASWAAVADLAAAQVTREASVGGVGAADFARTAYYMGTKRDLAPFLVEALAGVLPSEGVVLDLMCGSGAASGAFSRVWPTYASDAQVFCQHLAAIQGGGFSVARARACLARVLETARAHEAELCMPLGTLLRREADLCHSDLTQKLREQFLAYLADIPSYPGNGRAEAWNPSAEVALRRCDPRRRPFCLFTAYFAAFYFGLRQAVEIDSLRFGIEQLENGEERQWALGALIVAASVRATTYAAHFAQPSIRDPSGLPLARIGRILESWAGSIYHEFAVRFDRLAWQSESAKHRVRVVAGPWRETLEQFARLVPVRPVAVYLDAPYTREEFSRYYHVLETLVRYNYPSATGRGKVPSKALGERFASELFTRTQRTMEDNIVRIIRAVISKGWTCAWSYSNAGLARIPAVLEKVAREEACRIESFAYPHRYVSQRGKPRKNVIEHVVLFVPTA